MRRLLRVIVHNWPLKLAAIGLATLLYGGLVLSQSTQEFRDVIPVEVENQCACAFLLTAPEPVTLIRYFAPSGVQPTAAIFRATVDLADVPTEGGPQTVPITVISADPRITVLSAEPDVAVVELDALVEREVPVEVDNGTIPTGLELGPTTFEPQEVTVSGPASIVERVVAARASVLIQPGGIDIDEDVTLVPVDQLGDTVAPLDVDPPTAHVTIPVFSDRQSRTLPISPLLSGAPAPGFETASVTVDPLVVTVEGDADQLVELVSIETEPVSVSGLSGDETFTVDLVLPPGVVVLGSPTVEVSVAVRQVTATRSIEVGIRLDGTDPDLIYEASLEQIVVTIGGSTADLDDLDGSTLVAILDVSAVGPGTTAVPVAVDLPGGLSLVAANPADVEVTVTEPPDPEPEHVASRFAGRRRLTAVARLFGTDGIRGVANVDLRPTIAYALGRATAHRLVGTGGSLLVGQDTRRSGDLFVAAITAGATSLGVDVHAVGVVPTPALAYLTRTGPASAGIMVSASHNPADDNGLKVLDSEGLKLDDDVEDELEGLIWREGELGGVGNAELGRRIDATDMLAAYLDHRTGLARSIDASELRIVLDGANGSGSAFGPRIVSATGATVEAIHVEPDGVNINVRSGATDPASLAEAVIARDADVGFALDGDADRLIAVDATGTVVDGDVVLGILALERLARGALPGGLVVSVLSNGGLQAAVEEAGGSIVRTPVGDKYILEGMQVSGARLGGEKSGHVIILEHTTSGDGIVTALEVLRVMTERAMSLADLAASIPMLPQQQRAVRVRHKDQWEGDAVLGRAIADATTRLGGAGRILVRPSGTEPSLRVMVEGPDAALVSELADALATLAEERLH